MDVDDAARVTRDLLFRRQWTAKRTVSMMLVKISWHTFRLSYFRLAFDLLMWSKAARLAELAIHLGSSDNVTVIVVRVMDCVGKVHRSAMHGS